MATSAHRGELSIKLRLQECFGVAVNDPNRDARSMVLLGHERSNYFAGSLAMFGHPVNPT